jgi:hypothetical protein
MLINNPLVKQYAKDFSYADNTLFRAPMGRR